MCLYTLVNTVNILWQHLFHKFFEHVQNLSGIRLHSPATHANIIAHWKVSKHYGDSFMNIFFQLVPAQWHHIKTVRPLAFQSGQEINSVCPNWNNLKSHRQQLIHSLFKTFPSKTQLRNLICVFPQNSMIIARKLINIWILFKKTMMTERTHNIFSFLL